MWEELYDTIWHEPFEPFRINLVNGDRHNVVYPGNVALMEWGVSIRSPDQNWVTFSIDKIASVESLIADYHGHGQSE